MMNGNKGKLAVLLALVMALVMVVTAMPAMAETYYSKDATAEDVVKDAASKGKVGNWGLGNEYEIQALLSKYGQPTTYLSQAFDMDGFDDDSILLASAMTYNELGLVKNAYQGGYNYGDKVKVIDMNDEGVACWRTTFLPPPHLPLPTPTRSRLSLPRPSKAGLMPAPTPPKLPKSCINTVPPYPASIRRTWPKK